MPDQKLKFHLAEKVILCLIILTGFVLFVSNISAGSEQSMYVDELFYDRYAMEIAGWFVSDEPVKFSYTHPSGYSMVLMGVYGLYFIYGKITGQFSGLGSFLVQFATHRQDFIVLARLVSALFALGVIPYLFLLARRMFNSRVALMVALVFVWSYPVVFYAHIAANITMLMFLTTGAMSHIYSIFERGYFRDYLFAGLFIGVGVGTKYYPVLLFIPFFVAHLYRYGWRAGFFKGENFVKLFIMGMVALGGAVAFFPIPFFAYDQWAYALKDTSGYYTGGNPFANAAQMLIGTVPYYEATALEPSPWWSNSLLAWNETNLMMAAFGMVYMSFCRRKALLLLSTPFVVLFFVQCVKGGLGLGVRQLYFAFPGLLLLGIASFDATVNKLAISGIYKKIVFAAGAVFILSQSVLWTIQYISLLSGNTTIEIGRKWILENVPEKSVLLCDGSAAPFGETDGWWEFDKTKKDEIAVARKKAAKFRVISMKWENAKEECEEALRLGNPFYVVTTDYFFSQYWAPETLNAWGNMRINKAKEMRAYVEYIQKHADKLIEIKPRAVNAFGPAITIFRIDSMQ